MADTLFPALNFPALIRALDLVVVERQPTGTFQLLTLPPAWFERALETGVPGGRRSLDAAFPFLADVVHQAMGAWQAGAHASIVCGPFAANIGGDELLMRATALTVEKRPLLVIERLIGAADTRPMLQKAREHMLEKEQLVRLAEHLHAPVAALDGTIAALAGTTLSDDQRTLADQLQSAFANLQSAMTGLPTPPPKRRR